MWTYSNFGPMTRCTDFYKGLQLRSQPICKTDVPYLQVMQTDIYQITLGAHIKQICSTGSWKEVHSRSSVPKIFYQNYAQTSEKKEPMQPYQNHISWCHTIYLLLSRGNGTERMQSSITFDQSSQDIRKSYWNRTLE